MATDKLKQSAVSEAKELQKGFDEAISEKEDGTLSIEVHGRSFDLPAKKPAWIDLFIARYGRGKDREVPAEKYLDFILNLLGDEMTDHIIETADNEFDNEQFQSLIGAIMGAWSTGGETKKKK